jgi:hypothetical protein
MKTTTRPGADAAEGFSVERADRADCDESGFNIVIELDDSELSQVGGAGPTKTISW